MQRRRPRWTGTVETGRPWIEMSSVTQTGKHQSAEQARAEHETTTPAHRKRHLAAALGGLLFGYDTGIIASAQLYFVPEFGLSSTMQEVAVASLLAGAVVGVLIGGPVTDRFGRKKTLGVVAAVFIVGSVVSALAPDVEVLIGARTLLGLCIGASSLAVPSYIAEISPPAIRGRLVSMNQMLVMSGIFIAYLVGFAFESTKGWRWMLGIGVVPATLMLIGIPFIVESPRWLLDHGRPDQARSVMTRLLPPEVIDQQMQEITEATQAEEHISYRYLLNPIDATGNPARCRRGRNQSTRGSQRNPLLHTDPAAPRRPGGQRLADQHGRPGRRRGDLHPRRAAVHRQARATPPAAERNRRSHRTARAHRCALSTAEHRGINRLIGA